MISESRKLHQNCRTDYLPDFSQVVALVDTESFDSHSRIIVSALPNIGGITRGDRMLSGLDEPIGDDVGSWELSRSAAKLAELLKYLHIVV